MVLGEVLCDLFPPRPGISHAEAASMVPLLGGAPANVAVQLARLGVRTGFISAIGDDPFGARAINELRREGVDTRHVRRCSGFRTGVTLVEVDSSGERRFFPLADRRADLTLGPADVKAQFVRTFAVAHIGTVSLRAPSSKAATEALVKAARAAGRIVSLDVNLRWGMYTTREMLLRRARAALKQAHVVKATRDEARALLDVGPRIGDRTLAEGLLDAGPRLVLLTLDADGAVVSNRHGAAHIRAPRVHVVDATGAGDAFVGAALRVLANTTRTPDDLDRMDVTALRALGDAGCTAGSAACTALGATTAMVKIREI